MLAIWCNKSVCHLVQTVGFNTEMFVPQAKRFLKDTKLPFKFLKLGHLPFSGNNEGYVLVETLSIKKQQPFLLSKWNFASISRLGQKFSTADQFLRTSACHKEKKAPVGKGGENSPIK